MNVSLPPELESFVAEQVRSGRFRNADEVIAEALAHLKELQEEHAARHEALRQAVMVGVEQLRRGECVDGPASLKALLARIAEREQAS